MTYTLTCGSLPVLPEAARRLAVEIAGTAPFPSVGCGGPGFIMHI